MATSAVILLSLLNNNRTMSNIYDLNYFKTQEKNKLLEIKKQQYERKVHMFNNKIQKTYNSNKHNHSNYNIFKENKR